MKSISKPVIIATSAALAVTGIGVYAWREEHRPPILEVYVFSLPSGRSMFVRTPEDKRILIDGGSNSNIIREITGILPFYSRRIDSVIATNAEGKNISGLIDVLERYQIGEAYIPGQILQTLGISSSTDQIYSTFLDTLSREGIHTSELSAGDSVALDQKTSLRPLFPVPAKQFTYSKASAPEILFNVSFGATSIVFLGNASNKVQKFLTSPPSTGSLTSSGVDQADVLIVSHSALPANVSPELIKKISPAYLVYSKTLDREGTKKKIIPDPFAYLSEDRKFNLKESGTVKITSDGATVQIKKARRP